MASKRFHLCVATIVLLAGSSVFAQSSHVAALPPPEAKAQPLFDFKDSDIKFSLHSLMSTLRDRRHEGWVLAAYPDPKTKRPLIGAGFSLDVAAVEHPQRDLLNPHTFLEPSSEQLWQAAGMEPLRLQRILDKYNRDLATLSAKKRRRKVRLQTLSPQLTDEEAMRLLRISAIQATYNARAYCRNFDQLTASQQMALSQLVFQMGVNLEGFVQFLAVLNGDPIPPPLTTADTTQINPMNQINPINRPAMLENVSLTTTPVVAPVTLSPDPWRNWQTMLIDSQWARLYTDRAVAVIAMFDPAYADDPQAAQRRVHLILRPTAVHRHAARIASLKTASYHKRSAKGTHRAAASPRRKRRLS